MHSWSTRTLDGLSSVSNDSTSFHLWELAGSCFKCLPSLSERFLTSSPRTAALSAFTCCNDASRIQSPVLSISWSHSLTEVQRRADLHAWAASVLNWFEKCFMDETYPGPFPALTNIVSMKEAVCRSCKGFLSTRDIFSNRVAVPTHQYWHKHKILSQNGYGKRIPWQKIQDDNIDLSSWPNNMWPLKIGSLNLSLLSQRPHEIKA